MQDTRQRYNVVVLVSGGGSNMRAVLKDSMRDELYRVTDVIADRECGATDSITNSATSGASDGGATNINVTITANSNLKPVLYDIEDRLANDVNNGNGINSKKIDLIVLAGYLSIIDADVIKKYGGRIINIHPSLLPKYGGRGMYGINVHRAVIASDDIYSGATVHYVDGGIDTGSIIMQEKILIEKNRVSAEDVLEVALEDVSDEGKAISASEAASVALKKKVLAVEHKLLPRAIRKLLKKNISNYDIYGIM